jgi:hypothetical protein
VIDNLEENALLERVAQWRARSSDNILSEERLQQIAAVEGIDFATALLYDDVLRSPRHGSFIEKINALRNSSSTANQRMEGLLAIAPGAFYREFPHSGADGRLLQEQAAMLGCSCEVIPTDGMGGIAENGRRICDWLGSRCEQPIILASISKGGSDIKAALARPEAPERFRRVVAWINLAGILDGSPAVEWLVQSNMRMLVYRTLFWWKGLRFEPIRDLRRSPGAALDFPLHLPEHICAIHVIGFPLRAHLSNRLTRTLHGRSAAYGPNDGALLLSDTLRMPGFVYPIWGADHYLRPSWDLRSLASALLRYLASELNLREPGAFVPAVSS